MHVTRLLQLLELVPAHAPYKKIIDDIIKGVRAFLTLSMPASRQVVASSYVSSDGIRYHLHQVLQCDDSLWATRDDDNDRDAVSYLAEYCAKASADDHAAGNDNSMPPLVYNHDDDLGCFQVKF